MDSRASVDYYSVTASLVWFAKWVFAGAAGLWLAVPAATHLLVYCMILDFATGLLAAYIGKTLSSDKSFVGLARKITILVLVATAHIIARTLHMGFDLGMAAAGAYVVNECISIAENASRAGIPIPPALLDALLKAKSLTGRGHEKDVVAQLEET